MSTNQVAVSASIPPPCFFLQMFGPLRPKHFHLMRLYFIWKINILNPNQFKSTDQVVVSASIPAPLPFFFQMFGPFGPKHIN